MADLPWAEAASSTVDLACRATSRYRPSGNRLVRPCMEAIRSSAPHIIAMTFGAAATSAAFTTPRAVSHSATTRQSAPRPSSCARVSVLGSMISRYGVPRSAAMSAACSGVPVALTRTMTRAGSRTDATSAARAASLPSAPTPSSRSRMAASAAARAFAYRSGRSAGQNSSAGPGRDAGSGGVILHLRLERVVRLARRGWLAPCGWLARRARLVGQIRPASHQRRPRDDGHDLAVLVARGVLERHDPLAGSARRKPLFRHDRLTVDRVAVPDGSGEARVAEAEVRHDRPLGQVADGEPDEDGHGQQAVDKALAELGGRAERRVEVQGLRVHGQRGKQRVVRLAERPAWRVLVDDPGPQLLEPQPALLNHLTRRLAHVPSRKAGFGNDLTDRRAPRPRPPGLREPCPPSAEPHGKRR